MKREQIDAGPQRNDIPATRKCAHEGCTCEIREGQTYCGPFCATAAAETDVHHEQGRCECGHDACKAAVAPGTFS